MRRALAACLLAALAAGCSGPSPPPTPPATAAPCAGLLLEGTCIDPYGAVVELSGCREVRVVLDLDRAAYDLPAGYSDRPTTLAPQRVGVSLDRCASLRAGNLTAQDVSLLHVGVLVEADAPVDGAEYDLLTVETATDSPLLGALLDATGFPAVAAQVTVTDAGAAQRADAQGAIDYTATSEAPPSGPGLLVNTGVGHSEGRHGAASWALEGRRCDTVNAPSAVQVDARAGALASAMPAAGPLHGQSVQALRCDLVLAFGRASLGS